jgi:hypothetical protein
MFMEILRIKWGVNFLPTRWRRRFLLGGVLYLLYALVILAFLTGVAGKRVVAAPVFAPYAAAPAPEPVRVSLADRLSGSARPAYRTGGTPPAAGLRLPDLEILEPYDLHTVGSQDTEDLRLKFGTMIWNAGAGPLETRGAQNPETKRLEVYQYLYPQGGGEARRGRRIGTFDYNHRHGHLHLQTFARYQLWSLGPRGEPEEAVATNDKVGFCLMDIEPVDLERRNAAPAPVYAGCRADVQGISVGYGDEYVAQLFEQDLDITDLPDGNYALVTTTNPNREIVEAGYGNNTSAVMIALKGGALAPYPLER